MPDLLHEFWRSESGGQFGRVSRASDELRAKMAPDIHFEFEIWAASWREAVRLYEERAYGEFGKSYDHFPDTVYTIDEVEEQRAYLNIRAGVG